MIDLASLAEGLKPYIVRWLRPRVAARVYRSTNQAITDGATGGWQAISFSAERYDTDGMWTALPNPTRLTVATPGIYEISGNLRFASDGAGTGIRSVRIYLNGTTSIANAKQHTPSASQTDFFNLSTQYELAANDYLELQVYQTSGGNLNVDTSGNTSPEFMMARVG